jgi:uncharacterized protein (DUF1778 family)
VSSYEATNDRSGRDYDDRSDRGSDTEEERQFSGRFPVRLPRYLHRYLVEVAHEQGVSLNQFVYTAAVRAAEAVSENQADFHVGTDRVSETEYARIMHDTWG